MNKIATKPAILLLQDGRVFHGRAAGAIGTTTGEIAFNTGMTGYQEVFTEPSYYGQILVMATSHIGNYGIHSEEVESDTVKIEGLVVKKFSKDYSRSVAGMSLQEYFERDGKVAICDIDTRALIRHIRNKGAMNAIISSEETNIEKLQARLEAVPSMSGLELSSKVSCSEAYDVGNSNAAFRVGVLDFGAKKNTIACLIERDCYVRVFPMDTSLEEMESWNPDGYMLSNGPGDPSVMRDSINLVNEIVETNRPVFGICLGHQLLALAKGLTTTKMFNGHRGVNHPVKNVLTGKCEITSQNHGFVVDMTSAKNNPDIIITHTHVNDGTLAGLKFKDRPVFSVQFHPESSPGPHDSRYLFDDFIRHLEKAKEAVTV